MFAVSTNTREETIAEVPNSCAVKDGGEQTKRKNARIGE
jgi:hypothetical protein